MSREDASKIVDHTAIAYRIRIVSWHENKHQTGVFTWCTDLVGTRGL